MRLNKRGQALVEFIIILPIFIFITFMVIDYGNIGYNKNKIENIMNDVESMYKNNESVEEIQTFLNKNDNNLKFEYKENDKYSEIIVSKKYDFITPGMSKLMNNFTIKVERTIYNEQ